MELYLLRHGIAEDSAISRRDADRALTPEGKRKLRDILKVAHQAELSPTLILSSPYKRAKESAVVAAKVLGYKAEILETNALVPNAHPNELWEAVRMHKSEAKLLLVSHEPLLGSAASLLLNSSGLRIDVKKGAILRIDIEGFSPQPAGVLKWYLTPRLVP